MQPPSSLRSLPPRRRVSTFGRPGGTDMADREFQAETLAIHAGQIPDVATGARALPIYQTTSFVFDSADHAASLFNLQTFGNVYSRSSNPTVAALEECVMVESGKFPWDNGKFPGMTEASPGCHGVRFYETFGDFGLCMRARMETLRVYGAASSPTSAWQILQGVQTLPLRMERHRRNALAAARFLQAHPRVSWVNYPGLPQHPQHALLRRQMRALDGEPMASGLLAFGVKGGAAAGVKFIEGAQLNERSSDLAPACSRRTLRARSGCAADGGASRGAAPLLLVRRQLRLFALQQPPRRMRQPGQAQHGGQRDEPAAQARLIVEQVGVAQAQRRIDVELPDDDHHRQPHAEEEALQHEPGRRPRHAQRGAGQQQRGALCGLDAGVAQRQVEHARHHQHRQHHAHGHQPADAVGVGAGDEAARAGRQSRGKQGAGQHPQRELQQHVAPHAGLQPLARSRPGQREQQHQPQHGLLPGVGARELHGRRLARWRA